MLVVSQYSGLAAGGALTSITQVASAISALSTIVGPASILPGDLLVLWDWASALGGAAPAAVVPTGFAIIQNTTEGEGSGTRTLLSMKIANGSEANATLTGMDSASELKVLVVFRGDVPISAIAALSAAGQITDGNPAAQNVTSGAGAVPFVVIAGYAVNPSAGSVDPRTFSPTKDGEVAGTNNDAYVAWKIYNSEPADVSVDIDDEGTISSLSSCYIQCA